MFVRLLQLDLDVETMFVGYDVLTTFGEFAILTYC